MRSFLMMLTLLAVAATAAANDDVQDVHLRVQNLTRPDGKQSATLTGLAAPVVPAQTISVALRIDGSTVVLAGRISRNGKLRAVGRRLALATPLASFTAIDVDVSGGLTTSLTLVAGGCVASSRGRRVDCVETTVPTPTPTLTPTPTPTATTPGDLVDGAYDFTIANWTQPGTTPPGSITTNPNGTRALRLWMSPLDYVMLTMAADGALTGYRVFGGDAFAMVAGSATDESTISLARLTGTYSGSFVGTQVFTMERVADGTSAAFGGTWNLTLDGGGFMPFSGTAVVDLTVPADGLGSAAPTTFVRTGGMTAYTTNTGPCTVAPAGGVYCRLPRTVGMGAVFLHGTLDADSGQGTFAIGEAPAIESTGTWTATR